MHGTEIQSCGICGSSSLEMIWELPKFPLTEKFGLYAPEKQLHFDQKLLLCPCCGHVQLGIQLAPELLYTPSEYSFRTSQSHSARVGSQGFFDFFSQIQGNRQFHSLIDVGGNDLYLAKKMGIKERCVIDPVCSDIDGQTIDGIRIIGKMLEEVNLEENGLRPDLIFCRHVLEHVAKPKEFLGQLFRQCASDALYVFEIPCFENLMEANRYDAIFHQHYHYFDLSTFKRLIEEMDGEYLAHHVNPRGSCGGALLIAFQKGKKNGTLEKIEIQERKRQILRSIGEYQIQMGLISSRLHRLRGQIYGYGASLMLATLGYHLKTDFSELICILDDDPKKDGMGYQNFPVAVRNTGKYQVAPDGNFLITSLENIRPIFKRILELYPKRIFAPLVN